MDLIFVFSFDHLRITLFLSKILKEYECYSSAILTYLQVYLEHEEELKLLLLNYSLCG